MPSFATADLEPSSKGKETPKKEGAAGGRKPVKTIIIWTGVICVIALMINWNVSRLQTTAKGSRGGASVQSSVSAQGDSQCISPHKGDTPTAVCQAFCSEKFMKFHCKWCKCRACTFCPKGGEAIEEAANAISAANSSSPNASTALGNMSMASAPPSAMSNGTASATATGDAELASALAAGGAGGSMDAGAPTEAAPYADGAAGNATATDGAGSDAAGTNATAAVPPVEAVAGSEAAPAAATTGAAPASAAAAAGANGTAAAATAVAEPPPPQTPEEAGAADAAGIQEDSADEELDEPLGEEVAGADSDIAVADSGIAVAES